MTDQDRRSEEGPRTRAVLTRHVVAGAILLALLSVPACLVFFSSRTYVRLIEDAIASHATARGCWHNGIFTRIHFPPPATRAAGVETFCRPNTPAGLRVPTADLPLLHPIATVHTQAGWPWMAGQVFVMAAVAGAVTVAGYFCDSHAARTRLVRGVWLAVALEHIVLASAGARGAIRTESLSGVLVRCPLSLQSSGGHYELALGFWAGTGLLNLVCVAILSVCWWASSLAVWRILATPRTKRPKKR